MTLEVQCPTCDEVFDLDEFDPSRETTDTECPNPECKARLEVSEYDAASGDYSIEDIDAEEETETADEEEEEVEEETGVLITDEEEDEEENEG